MLFMRRRSVWFRGLCCALGLASIAVASQAAPYNRTIRFDVRQVPFSRYGSYIAFSHLRQGPLGEGLYLRSVHGGVRQEVFKIDLLDDGQIVNFREVADPIVLRLDASKGGYAEICIARTDQVRVSGRGVAIRFSKMPNAGGYGFLIASNRWEFNASSQDIKLMFSASKGGLRGHAEWNGTNSEMTEFAFEGVEPHGEFEGSIDEFKDHWVAPGSDRSFENDVLQLEREYRAWLSHMPVVPEEFQASADLAAYIIWSAFVRPEGYLKRPAMLMSKNWMSAVWSWDHCFNAMALFEGNPEAAWAQYMLLFDQQNPQGALPDRLTDRELLWSFSKPPVHGWTLAWMMAHGNSLTPKQLEEIYDPLSRWTNWYFQFRDEDHDGLPEYQHGNDSGWDNSTVFRTGPAVESPDLASFLVIQMETLATVANRLGRKQESEQWKRRASELLTELLDAYWKNGHFIAREFPSHQEIIANSLQLYLPIVLGKRLPERARKQLIADLQKPNEFLTQHGLATEKPSSKFYEADGYWRGPIWAPSTMLIVSGLEASGEQKFAAELKLRFCRMAAEHGFGENYDAISGASLRDPDYTWSASVFLMFAHELGETRNSQRSPSNSLP